MEQRVVCSDNLNTAHTARLCPPQLCNLVFLAKNLGSTNQEETQHQLANTKHNMEEDMQEEGRRVVYTSGCNLLTVGRPYTHLCPLKSTGFIYSHKFIIIIVIIANNNNNNGTNNCSICFTSWAYLVTIWNPLWAVSAAGRMKGQKRADGTDGSRVTPRAFGPFPCCFM